MKDKSSQTKQKELVREKKIRFVKNYKKGPFLLINVINIFAFSIGIQSASFWNKVADSVKYGIKMTLLDFNYDIISNYASGNALYKWMMVIIFVFCIFSALLLFLSLIGQRFFNWIATLKKKNNKNSYYIYGYSPKSIDIAKTNIKETILIDFLNHDEEENLYIKKISYVNLKNDRGDLYVDNITSKAKRDLNRKKRDNKTIVIVNDEIDESLSIVSRFADFFKTDNSNYKSSSEYNKGLMVKVFINPIEESAFEKITKEAKGRIQMINKYEVMAFDFVSKYPVTKYMDGNTITFENGSIKDNIEINMVYIGFGDTNQRIFLNEFANNALYTISNDELHLKKINYHFFDKDDPKDNLALNHTVFRYFLEKDNIAKKATENQENPNEVKKDLLPLPEVPFDYSESLFHSLDVNKPSFYEELFKIVNNEGTYNYIHVCVGSDMENYDLASMIEAKISSDGSKGTTKIFVRIRNDELAEKVKTQRLICFGMDKVVNDIKNIENEKYAAMELKRHIFYSCDDYKKEHSADEDATPERIEPAAIKEWEGMPPAKRISNIYSCLNLRLKLNLIGFDLVDESEEGVAVTEKEFMDKYAKNDPLTYELFTINSIKPVDYDRIDIRKKSLRNNLAQQEHMRWNLFMIMSGFIPTREKVKIRDYVTRIHWNLTDHKGLLEQEEVSPSIRYDYQIMDSVYWLVREQGMKIIKKVQ